jgi:hypothetical protein
LRFKRVELDVMPIGRIMPKTPHTELLLFRWHLGGAGMHFLRQHAIGFVYFWKNDASRKYDNVEIRHALSIRGGNQNTPKMAIDAVRVGTSVQKTATCHYFSSHIATCTLK